MHGSSTLADEVTARVRGVKGVVAADASARAERLVGQRTQQDLPAGEGNGGAFQGATPVPVGHEPCCRRLVTWIAHDPSMHAYEPKAQATLAVQKH